MNHLEDLYHWVDERERIRIKKDVVRQSPPWTDDPIMASNRFCNVRREDDKVTRWIHKNWLLPHIKDESVQFAMCVARLVNHPETLEELGYPDDWQDDRFIKVIQQRSERGLKSWTSAYMITGGYSAGGEPKGVIIARVLTTAHNGLRAHPIVVGDSLDNAALKIRHPGIGSFLVGQIIADLKWATVLRYAVDWHSWCAVGPGSSAGLNYLHGRPPLTSLSQAKFQREVGEVRALLYAREYDLDAQNVQNCLCEFSKYVRVKYYGGHAKSSYRAVDTASR